MSDEAGPVRAHLEGAERDFQTIVRLFAGAEIGVERQDDGAWVLFAPELDAVWGGDGTELHEMTVDLVRDLNGVARALDADHRPVRATGRYDGPGNNVHVIGADTAVIMLSASVVMALRECPRRC